jgi:hypothetical protein
MIVDLPDPGGDGRTDRRRHRDRRDRPAGLYLLLLSTPGIKQFFDPAHDSLIPEIASDEELPRRELVPVDRLVRFDRHRVRRGGSAGRQRRPAMGVHHRRLSFVVRGRLHRADGRLRDAQPDDDASVAVIVSNLKSGMAVLFGTPIIRSLFVVGAFMFFSFGLWNVLLLPFTLKTLHATEFQYGLQEGLTSSGSFAARSSWPVLEQLPEPAWIVLAMTGWVSAASCTACPPRSAVAILLVMVSGFFNSPSSVARSVLLQRNTPREMRGRVFSSFYVMRDVVFLFGWPAPAWPTSSISGCSSCPPRRSSSCRQRSRSSPLAWRLDVGRRVGSTARCHRRAGPRRSHCQGGHARRLRPAGRTPRRIHQALSGPAVRLRPAATVLDSPEGTRIIEHGDAATSAYFILDGSTTAGIPVEDGYSGLSTMTAVTSSARSAP